MPHYKYQVRATYHEALHLSGSWTGYPTLTSCACQAPEPAGLRSGHLSGVLLALQHVPARDEALDLLLRRKTLQRLRRYLRYAFEYAERGETVFTSRRLAALRQSLPGRYAGRERDIREPSYDHDLVGRDITFLGWPECERWKVQESGRKYR